MRVEPASRGVTRTAPALPPSLRVPIGLVAIFAALVVAVVGVYYSGHAVAGPFDQWALSAVGGTVFQPSPARTAALIVDFGSEPVGAAVLVTALVVTCAALGRHRLAVLAVAGPGLTVAATTLLKPVVERTINGGHLSYPSGHTAMATALALVAALLVVDLLRPGKAAATLLVLAATTTAGAAMAWSQTALLAHYATDTLGGFCTALALVPAVAWLIDLVADRVGSSSGRVGSSDATTTDG